MKVALQKAPLALKKCERSLQLLKGRLSVAVGRIFVTFQAMLEKKDSC